MIESKVVLYASFITTFWAAQSHAQMFVDNAVPMGVFHLISSDEYGSGVSVFDFNQDGLDDITLANSFGNLILYENNGDGFDLINPGLYSPGWTKQVLWVDYNEDGNLDLFLTSYGGQIKLYRNEGGFAFNDVTAISGLPNAANWNAGACFGDYDKDGFLDLYICQYADSNYSPVNDGMINKLYRNLGNGTFLNVTTSSEIQADLALSFQSVWLDFNNDNWPDLYVINDRIYGNKLHINNGDGTFTDVTDSAGMSFPNNDVMSNSVGDFNNDGFLDVFMTNTGSFVPPRPTLLAMNNGDSTFSEVGAEKNIDVYYNSWGAVWIDADNDGWQDMYFTTSDNTSNYFFLNDSGSAFIIDNEIVSTVTDNPCWSVAKGDFDNDGYADMAVQSRTPNRPYVLMNQGGNHHYAKISLSGTVSNSMAIGSWIHVYHNGQAYHQYTTCGNNYLSQDSQYKIFGLGPIDMDIDSVQVLFPSGFMDTYYDLPVDSAYHFTEGETFVAEILQGEVISICEGDTAALSTSSQESCLWSTGDTTNAVTISAGGTYVLTLTNTFGMSATDTVVVNVYPAPAITFDLNPLLCFGDSAGGISLFNQSMVPPSNVTWDNGMEGAEIDGLSEGTYSFIYNDENGCSASGAINLFSPSDMVVISESTPEYAGMMNGTISVNTFGGTSPYTFFLDSVQVGNYIVLLSAGTYALDVYDDNLCHEHQEITVESVLNQSGAMDKLTIQAFPNPVIDLLTIQSTYPISRLEIFDVHGRSMSQLKLETLDRVDLSTFPPGLYVLKVIDVLGEIHILKVNKI